MQCAWYRPTPSRSFWPKVMRGYLPRLFPLPRPDQYHARAMKEAPESLEPPTPNPATTPSVIQPLMSSLQQGGGAEEGAVDDLSERVKITMRTASVKLPLVHSQYLHRYLILSLPSQHPDSAGTRRGAPCQTRRRPQSANVCKCESACPNAPPYPHPPQRVNISRGLDLCRRSR